MNEEKCKSNHQQLTKTEDNCSTLINGCPDYQFWNRGISDERNSWLTPIVTFLKGRTSSEVIVLVAILALWRISHEFINVGGSDKIIPFIGCIIITSMIFAIALVAIIKGTKQNNAKSRCKKQQETPQSNSGD